MLLLLLLNTSQHLCVWILFADDLMKGFTKHYYMTRQIKNKHKMNALTDKSDIQKQSVLGH